MHIKYLIYIHYAIYPLAYSLFHKGQNEFIDPSMSFPNFNLHDVHTYIHEWSYALTFLQIWFIFCSELTYLLSVVMAVTWEGCLQSVCLKR